MTPYIDDSDFVLYVGDALDVLREMPAESVHCCVTSPPYWGLRDYGTGTWAAGDAECDHLGKPFRTKSQLNENWGAGYSDIKNAEDTEPMRQICTKCGATRVDQQLGLEPTPDLYVARMVAVFREVRRVLRADGTLWLNIGDSYNAYNGNRGLSGSTLEGTDRPEQRPKLPSGSGLSARGTTHLKPKDLVGIPWRLAFALQADGWYLRSDIIWSKPNPMPESVTDRPTKAHEYLFLLTKSPRYFYDADAIREPAEWARWGDQTNGKHEGSESAAGWIGSKSKAELQRGKTWEERKEAGAPMRHGLDGSAAHGDGGFAIGAGGRNKRSVWEIATAPYPDAHFATFPPALVEPCVKAGTSEHGSCPVCGAPWGRVITAESADGRRAEVRGGKAYDADGQPLSGDNMIDHGVRGSFNSGGTTLKRETTGWRPTCVHRSEVVSVPAVVLDPFMGSGTTAQVARRLGRRSIGIELNPEYAQLCAQRLQQLSLLA